MGYEKTSGKRGVTRAARNGPTYDYADTTDTVSLSLGVPKGAPSRRQRRRRRRDDGRNEGCWATARPAAPPVPYPVLPLSNKTTLPAPLPAHSLAHRQASILAIILRLNCTPHIHPLPDHAAATSIFRHLIPSFPCRFGCRLFHCYCWYR